MSDGIAYDPFSDAVMRDPWPFYAELRREAQGDRESRLWVALANRELGLIKQALGHRDEARHYSSRADSLLRQLERGALISLDPRDWLGAVSNLADGL